MGPKIENKVCFVISPIGAERSETYTKFKEVLDYVIRPAFDIPGLAVTVVRADEIAGPGSFIKDIVHRLAKSYLVIADLTDQNPNVFYELGVRHALSPRTILIAQDTNYIPSDLREYRTIVYDSTARGAVRFKERLQEYLAEIQSVPSKSDSPVLDRLPVDGSSSATALQQKIGELEGKLRQSDQTINKLSKELATLRAAKPKHSANAVNVQSSSGPSILIGTQPQRIPEQRLHRLLRMLDWHETSSTWLIWQNDARTHELESGRGPFHLFYPSNLVNDEADDDYLPEPPKELMYLANVAAPVAWPELLAEIRVTTASSFPRILTHFVIVCPDDMSGQREQLQGAFDKIMTFLDERHRGNFTFEVWDQLRLRELEIELGLSVL